ncbi:MAG: toll/interleukin-1 receptor domain-containing protein [Fimbriimonas sp.]|nr:toll/interleukin-1 receptor domain-containing protein [Fimbriimonas sp.]
MKFDLFVSYSRKDNEPDWISGFVEALKRRHLEFTGRELRVFFDQKEIGNGEQWRHRIRGGLRDSAYMMAVVSPNYFASDYCRWEFDEFASREFERLAVGEAIGPIYWVSVPGFPSEAHEDPWKADLSLRNMSPVPLCPWQEGLEESLRERDVSNVLSQPLEEIVRAVDDRSRRRDLAKASPTNMGEALTPNFVGRSRELVKLHESLAFGRVGAITSVQGIGGIGKTELAYAYAKAYAHEYPGGRWLVTCDRRIDLKQAIADALATWWQIPPLSADVTAEDRWAVFLANLEAHGKALFVLDNVSERDALASSALRDLPGQDHAAFLVTTRLGFKTREGELEVLDLDRLSSADGLALLHRFRPELVSPSDYESLAHVVDRLGGHALALEAVGVFLRENRGMGLADYVEWFDREMLEATEALKDDPSHTTTRHGEVVIGRLLAPTLERLAAESPLALEIARTAAFLPPDAVYEPWLRAIVLKGEVPQPIGSVPGKTDWQAALEALERNLIVRFQGPMGRMHRLVGGVLRPTKEGPDEVGGWIDAHVEEMLARPSHVVSSELDALEAWANGTTKVRSTDGGWSTIYLGRMLWRWRRLSGALGLYSRLVDLFPNIGDRSWVRLKSALYDEIGNLEASLGLREEALGRYRESLDLSREVLSTYGRSPEALRDVSVSLNKVADVEASLGLREEALGRYRESLDIRREVLSTYGRSPEALRDVSISCGRVASMLDNADATRRQVLNDGLRHIRSAIDQYGEWQEFVQVLNWLEKMQ